ncbi:MAG TPA: hypothetical protein VGG75_30880 [Trebonia sp.]|jgi:hypothetical protein
MQKVFRLVPELVKVRTGRQVGHDFSLVAPGSAAGPEEIVVGSAWIAARALVSPAGLIRLSVDPALALALASARWLLRPAYLDDVVSLVAEAANQAAG